MDRTNVEQVAHELGYPSTFMGLTPNEAHYWREPGLPWLTAEMLLNWPADAGQRPLIAYIGGTDMAPRFPQGCGVAISPIYDLTSLVVGRVYLYSYWPDGGPFREMMVGRLTVIGGNYLEVAADNHPTPAIWLLESGGRGYGLYEVTHYTSYPAL